MPLRESFYSPVGVGSPAHRAELLDPPLLLFGPRRPWRKNALGRHSWGLQWGCSFGVPGQCALISWVQGSGTRLPHQTGLPGSGGLSKPLARLEQEPLGHCRGSQPPPSLAPLTRLKGCTWETVHPFSLCLVVFVTFLPTPSCPPPCPTDKGSNPSPSADHLCDFRQLA